MRAWRALGVQEEAQRLTVEVRERDGVDLQLRVGLNSGQVIAGEMGSGAFGYTTIGEQVGMVQRMESAAPPGGVMLSASTARLVDDAAVLGEPELVQIKGADVPVAARRLLGMETKDRAVRRDEVGTRRAAVGDVRVEVFTAYGESHTSQIPFHVVARLLRRAPALTAFMCHGAGAGPRRCR